MVLFHARNLLRSRLFYGLSLNSRRNFSEPGLGKIMDTLQSPSAFSVELLPLSEMREAGLASSFTPTSLIESFVDVLHTSTGLPWWATIIAYATITKIVFFPFSLKQVQGSMKIAHLKPEMETLQRSIQNFTQQGNREEAARQYLLLRQLMSKNGVGTFSMLLPSIIPAPFYFCSFLAIREITSVSLPSMMTGGVLWFQNLCIPDPYFILPIFSSLGIIANVFASKLSNPNQPAWTQYIFYGLSVISIPITAQFNSAVVLYFCTINILNTLNTLIWKVPVLRRWFNILNPIAQKNTSSKMSFLENFKTRYDSFLENQQRNSVKHNIQTSIAPKGPARVVHKTC